MKNPTIVDVAKHAGVSKKTVSRVINDESGVKPETRNKVLASVKALNFTRNPFGLSLARKRSFLVALIYDNPSPSFLVGLQSGITTACQARNLGLYIHNCDYQSASLVDDIEQMIDRTMVDGLILTSPVSDQQPLLRRLRERNIAFVAINPSDDSQGLSVRVDHFSAAKAMTRHLLDLNHQRIAFIKGHPDLFSSIRRQAGFREAMTESGITIDEDLVVQGVNNFESARIATQQLLQLPQRPTAIFASNDEMAVGALYELNKTGLKVPEDISLAGFDDIPVAAHVWPPLTTIKQPFGEIGHTAASMLIEQFQHKNRKNYHSSNLINGQLILRESTSRNKA